MTNQEKKQWLLRYRDEDADIDSLIEERAVWMDRATKITTGVGGVAGGGDERGAMESAALRIAEIGSELDERIRRQNEVRREIRSAIARVKDPTLRSLLRLRYINGLRFEQIADLLHYSVRWTIRLHGRALDAVGVKSVH